jgi:hypothetical protein
MTNYRRIMSRLITVLLPALLLATTFSTVAATGRVVKVLPHFLDLKGRHALSPSLYERDAYQNQLRQNPEQRSGVRFDILWRVRAKAATSLKLKVEIRGIAQGNLPSEKVLEKEVKSGAGSRWTPITLGGDDFKAIGEVTAWRVSLWEGDQLIAEQKSFLW